MQDEKSYVQSEEIASKLNVPRHFMGKILKLLAKEKVLISVKGPSGGFTINGHTLKMPLIDLMDITDGMETFNICSLRMKECNPMNPCPIHQHMIVVRNKLQSILSDTVIGDLLNDKKKDLVKSISTTAEQKEKLSSKNYADRNIR